jgi:hypothetical protein
VLTTALACAPAFPNDPVERALIRDLTRVVDVRSRVGGWLIDETEVTGAMTDALRSVCQVPINHRLAAQTWLNQRIIEEGGDVAARWRELGRDLDRVDELLRHTRVRLLLTRAAEWQDQGRCPFWLEPSPNFAGVNTQGGRWIFTVDGGGRFTTEYALGSVKYGGGGGGRLLLGYGFAELWSVAFGLELGGSAKFTNLQLGEQSEFPELVGFGVVPMVLRWHFGLSTFSELEVGPMAYLGEGSADPITGRVSGKLDRGIHVGLGVGASYLRLERGLVPKFTFSVTVDHIPGRAGAPTLTQIGFGVRTGIDLSSWKRF